MRRRLMILKTNDILLPGEVAGGGAICGDVVFSSSDGSSLHIIHGQNNWPNSPYVPIGVVVVPGTHGVLKGNASGTVNACGIMSLVGMSSNTPETGDASNTEMTIPSGGYNLDVSGKSDYLNRYDSLNGTGLMNYMHLVKVSTSSPNVAAGSTQFSYIPIQLTVGGNATYYNTSNPLPSPYNNTTTKNTGGFNEAYRNVSYASDNALSDFKGIVNTKILTDLATGQSNWRTASTIDTSYSSNYFPRACCCARFHTKGTKAFVDCTTAELSKGVGFWYLPAFGELCYIFPKLADINDTITKLSTKYGIPNTPIPTSGRKQLFSSSEYNSANVRGIIISEGYASSSIGKQYYDYTRAFMRL